jgi:hypothetical protein
MKSFFQEFYQFRSEVLVEAIGTFILVFAGTGAVMVNNISQGAITHLGISFVFGVPESYKNLPKDRINKTKQNDHFVIWFSFGSFDSILR